MSTRKTPKKLTQEGGGTIDWMPEWAPAHPEANKYPIMGEDALAGLAASIIEIGQQEPISLDEQGRVLDGRNRYLVCMRNGIKPRTVVERDGGSPVKEWIRGKNTHRRHLTASQRVAEVRLAPSKLTQEQVALKAGCNQSMVARVDAGAGFLVEEGRAKSLTAAYSMIAYGQVTEGELRRRKQEQEKKAKIAHANEAQAERLNRASIELQKIVDKTPEADREAFADGLRAASSIVTRFNVSGLDLEKLVGYVTLEELDEDERDA